MKYYIVIGPIDGFYHVGYFVAQTKVYTSCQTSRSLGIAQMVAEQLNEKLESTIVDLAKQGV